MCIAGSQEFDGDRGMMSIQVANGAGLVKDTGRKSGVVGMQRGEDTTSRHAGIDVEVN